MHIAESLKLKPGRNRNGGVIAGIWQSDIVRMERDEKGWAADVPMRPIGTSGYYEFCSIDRGGHWFRLGHYRTRRMACNEAERLRSGNWVWKPGYMTGVGRIPAMPYEWARVADEIAAHPSVTSSEFNR